MHQRVRRSACPVAFRACSLLLRVVHEARRESAWRAVWGNEIASHRKTGCAKPLRLKPARLRLESYYSRGPTRMRQSFTRADHRAVWPSHDLKSARGLSDKPTPDSTPRLAPSEEESGGLAQLHASAAAHLTCPSVKTRQSDVKLPVLAEIWLLTSESCFDVIERNSHC